MNFFPNLFLIDYGSGQFKSVVPDGQHPWMAKVTEFCVWGLASHLSLTWNKENLQRIQHDFTTNDKNSWDKRPWSHEYHGVAILYRRLNYKQVRPIDRSPLKWKSVPVSVIIGLRTWKKVKWSGFRRRRRFTQKWQSQSTRKAPCLKE